MSNERSGAAGDRLPLIVHLILDEHIGLEGIPEDLAPASFKDEARTFFTDKGFKVFGGAYSELSVDTPINQPPAEPGRLPHTTLVCSRPVQRAAPTA